MTIIVTGGAGLMSFPKLFESAPKRAKMAQKRQKTADFDDFLRWS